MSGWYIYDPDPTPDAEASALIGPFDSEAAAVSFANVLHPDDGSGNAEILPVTDPADI